VAAGFLDLRDAYRGVEEMDCTAQEASRARDSRMEDVPTQVQLGTATILAQIADEESRGNLPEAWSTILRLPHPEDDFAAAVLPQIEARMEGSGYKITGWVTVGDGSGSMRRATLQPTEAKLEERRAAKTAADAARAPIQAESAIQEIQRQFERGSTSVTIEVPYSYANDDFVGVLVPEIQRLLNNRGIKCEITGREPVRANHPSSYSDRDTTYSVKLSLRSTMSEAEVANARALRLQQVPEQATLVVGNIRAQIAKLERENRLPEEATVRVDLPHHQDDFAAALLPEIQRQMGGAEYQILGFRGDGLSRTVALQPTAAKLEARRVAQARKFEERLPVQAELALGTIRKRIEFDPNTQVVRLDVPSDLASDEFTALLGGELRRLLDDRGIRCEITGWGPVRRSESHGWSSGDREFYFDIDLRSTAEAPAPEG
jgi:hypothetical protein